MKQRRSGAKKITAMLLALVMVVTAVQLPEPEYAEAATDNCTEEGCGGTYVNGFCSEVDTHYEAPELNSEGYYEIGNAGELYWFVAHVNEGGDNLSSNAVLTADIVVNEGTMTAESTGVREWVPICENPRGPEDVYANHLSNGFAGIFDGKGHSISGLFYADTEKTYVGLFGGITEGCVKNVGVTNSYIKADGKVGAIAGGVLRGEIIGCYSESMITTDSRTGDIGGIVGFCYYGVIRGCFNSGAIIGEKGSDVGGIVGNITDTQQVGIENCYNVGNVTGKAGVGGIAGHAYTFIRNCYNTGTVKGTGKNNYSSNTAGSTTISTSATGGIVGIDSFYYKNDVVYQNCYYLFGCATGSDGKTRQGIGADYEHATRTDVEGGTIPFDSLSDLTSGEICYLLNNGVTDGTQAFYQTVGSGMPAFSGEAVYYGYTDCNATEAIYANTPLNPTQGHSYSADCDRSCNYCGEKREVDVAHEVQSGGTQGDIIKVKCKTCKEEVGQLTFSVPKGAVYDGNPKPATISGTIEGQEIPQIQYGGIDGLPPVDAGTYTARVFLGGSSISKEYVIAKRTPSLGTVTVPAISNTLETSALQWKRTNSTVAGSFSLTGSLSYGTKSYSWTFVPTDLKNYNILSGAVSITVKDTIKPTATYTIGSSGAKEFGSVQQAGVVSKDPQTVTLSFADKNASGEDGSGVNTKQYFISDTWIEDKTSITGWTVYSSALTLSEPGQYYIYAKVTDKQDNVFYGVSEQIVIYEDSTLAPLTATYTYKEGQDRTFTLSTEANTVKEIRDVQGNVLLESEYQVNGKQITLKREYLDTLNKGTYTYTVVLNPQGLTDASLEQKCTFTITVNPVVVKTVGATANSKTYDGTTTVEVTDVALQGIRGADDVKVNVSAVQGRVAGADAGTYTTVALTGIALTGADAGNYLLEASSANVPAALAVVIGKRVYTDKVVDRQYLYLRENVDNIDLKEFLPADCGTVSYSMPVTAGGISWKEPTVANNGVLNYIVSEGSAGDAGSLTVSVSTQNYEDFTITVFATLTDQKPVYRQDSSATLLQSDTLTYGEALGSLQFCDVGFVDEAGNEVPGTLSWVTSEMIPDTTVQWATWVFTPVSVDYYTVTGNVAIAVNKATPYIGTLPMASDIFYGETLTQSALSGGEVWHSASVAQAVAGTFFWKNSTAAPKMSDSCVTEYAVVFIPADGANYNSVGTTVTVGVMKKAGEYTGFVERQYLYLRENSDRIDLTGLLPADCGVVEYGTPVVEGAIICKVAPEINAGVLSYTIDAGERNASGTITIPVTMENCQDITITVAITLNDQKAVVLKDSSVALLLSDTLTYGESVGMLQFNNVTFVDEEGNEVKGTLSWVNPECVPDEGEQYVSWIFTPDNIDFYTLTGTVKVFVKSVISEGGEDGSGEPENPEGNGPNDPAEPEEPCTHGETEVRNAYAASCTTSGYTGDAYCTLCEEVLTRGTIISARGHWYAGSVIKQPTVEEEGTYRYSCVNCGNSYEENMAKLPVTEPKEEPKEKESVPGLMGEEEKTGWSAILRELKKTEAGSVLTVDMNGTVVVPKRVLRKLEGLDVTMVFRVSEQVSWSINGKDVPERITKEINLGVLLDFPLTQEGELLNTSIPQELLREVVKENVYVTMRLAHEGEFGVITLLSVLLGEEHEGLFANLFYYNEEAGTLEYVGADEIGKDGRAEFDFVHASDYVIILADTSLKPQEPENPQEPEEPREPQEPERPQEPEEPQEPEKPQEQKEPEQPEESEKPSEPIEVEGYAVQLGAFSKKSNAEKLMKKGASVGFELYREDGALIKVQSELFGTRKEAEQVLKEFVTAGFDAFIIQTKRLVMEEETRQSSSEKMPVVPEKKSVQQLAEEVINGRWGNGSERKKRLTEAGYDYNEVQNLVNKWLQ